MFIDTHAHLNDEAFDDDLDEIIDKCNKANIGKILVVGFNKKTNEKALMLAHKYPFIYASIGLHPCDVKEYEGDYKLIENQLQDPKVVAVGECGLDYYWYQDNKELQKKVFKWQIELSIKYKKPLIIHMREASFDTISILKEYKDLKGVMHGYSGSVEMLKDFYDVGLFIALGGVVTFKNAVTPKEVSKALDIGKLVLETDCPYLTPHPYRGKRNDPSYIPLIAQEIALLRGISVSEVEKITTNNAIKLFGME